MRILLSYLCVVALLTSCQKESSFIQSKESSSGDDSLSQQAKKSKNYFIIDESSNTLGYPPNAIESYNPCYPESVYFSGLISYTVQFLQDGSDYYLSYDLDFSQFSAIGATSGLKYSINRWRFKDIIPSVTEYVDGDARIGRKIIEITLKAPAGNLLSVNENVDFYFSKTAHVFLTFKHTIIGCR